MKKTLSFITILLIFCTIAFLGAQTVLAIDLSTKLKGRILLQVESKGEAWYVSPADEKRYSLGRPNDAYELMRKLGVGITNDNLQKIQIANENFSGPDADNDGLSDMLEDSFGTDKNKPDTDSDNYNDKEEILNGYNPLKTGKLPLENNFTKQQSGKILLQVENKGEAWYVNPTDQKRYFLGRPDDAFNLMRKLGLGITNTDLNQIASAPINHDCDKCPLLSSPAPDFCKDGQIVVASRDSCGCLNAYTCAPKPNTLSSTCKPTNRCSGETKIDCLKNWLIESKCFSETYVNEHFSNFREKLSTNSTDWGIHFDYKFGNDLVLSVGWVGSTGLATIDGEPNNYTITKYIGPLKEYTLQISKSEAVNTSKSDTFCAMPSQSNIMDFVFLVVNDEFDGSQTTTNSLQDSNFTYDPDGLHWAIPTLECANICSVDAQTGKLIKKEGSCEY